MPPRTPLITFPVPHTSLSQTPSPGDPCLSASPYTLPPWPQRAPSDPLDRPLTPTANIALIPPIPLHWTSEFPNVRSTCVRATLKFIFMILCMVAFGHPTLKDRWQMTCLGSRAFERNRDVIVSRMKTLTVVASLILASIAALVTTVPPAAGVLDYTKRGPYICLWTSFGILLGGIVVASADVYALATSSPVWVLKVTMTTRARLWCALILLAYPFFAIGCGTIVAVLGLLAAAWSSDDKFVQTGCVSLLLVPASLIFLFLFAMRGPLPEELLV